MVAWDCGLHKLGLTVPPVHSHLKGGFLYFKGRTEPSGLLTPCISSVIILSFGIAAMVSQATAKAGSIIIERGAGTGKGDAEIKS